MIRTFQFRITLLAALTTVAGACGKQTTEETIVVVEPEIQDIPGVNREAVAAFNEGIAQMGETPTNYAAALASFERAYALDPNFWEALENIGLIQLDLARYNEAAEAFRAELALIDDLIQRNWPVEPRPDVYLSLGKALSLGGRTEEAAQAFAQLIQLDPENVEARANLAALNLQTGNVEGARLYISELLEMSLNDVGALNVLALLSKQQGDLQMATYLWEKCLGEIDRTRERYADEAQYEGMSEEDAERARQVNAHRTERLEKLLSDVQNELAIVAWNEGEADRAQSLFRSAVANNPSNALARVNLGVIYLDYANFAEACAQFSEVLALRPRNEEALVGLGSCTYGLNDIDGAYLAFEQAHEQYPSNDYVLRRLGEIAYQDRNDTGAAIGWYEALLAERDMAEATCPDTDRDCSTLRALRQMQQSTTPQQPQ